MPPPPPERSPDKPPGGAGDWTQALREAAPYLGLGLSMALTVLAGAGGGYWLDERLGTRPAFLLVGALGGMCAAFYHLIKTVGRKR